MRTAGMVLIGLCACGRLRFDDSTDAAAGPGDGGFGPFGPAQSLASLNSAVQDVAPSLSTDGLEVYFGSSRGGTFHVFRATRTAEDQPFGTPTMITLGGATTASEPELSSDGRRLYFWRDGSEIAFSDLVTPPDVWGPSSPAIELMGFRGIDLAVGDTLAIVEKAGVLYEATRPDRTSPFGPPTVVQGISVPMSDYPMLSADGLELWFEGGAATVYRALRPGLTAPFGTPELVVLRPSAGAHFEGDPELSSNGTLLLFASDGGGAAAYDIYQASREAW